MENIYIYLVRPNGRSELGTGVKTTRIKKEEKQLDIWGGDD